jgi:hypothetical protein
MFGEMLDRRQGPRTKGLERSDLLTEEDRANNTIGITFVIKPLTGRYMFPNFIPWLHLNTLAYLSY